MESCYDCKYYHAEYGGVCFAQKNAPQVFCCGCPDHGEWEKEVQTFKDRHGLTDDILKNETVKHYIAAYNECVFASLALKAAKERDINAGIAYQDARDAFTISAPVTVAQHKIKEE